MIELKHKTKEVTIILKYSSPIGGKTKLDILGEGDLPHHLIEETFALLDKLARMESVGHQSGEWRTR